MQRGGGCSIKTEWSMELSLRRWAFDSLNEDGAAPADKNVSGRETSQSRLQGKAGHSTGRAGGLECLEYIKSSRWWKTDNARQNSVKPRRYGKDWVLFWDEDPLNDYEKIINNMLWFKV